MMALAVWRDLISTSLGIYGYADASDWAVSNIMVPLPYTVPFTSSRQCLGLIERYGFGLTILTKFARILRDLDTLKAINAKAKCVVLYSTQICVEYCVETTQDFCWQIRGDNLKG